MTIFYSHTEPLLIKYSPVRFHLSPATTILNESPANALLLIILKDRVLPERFQILQYPGYQ